MAIRHPPRVSLHSYSAATSFPITTKVAPLSTPNTSPHSPPQPSGSPATVHPSPLLARPLAESVQSADSQLCCSDGAFHSWPSFHCHQPLLASFCQSNPWMAFAGLGQFFAQWPRSALQTNVFVGISLSFCPHPFLPPLPLESLPLLLLLFWQQSFAR